MSPARGAATWREDRMRRVQPWLDGLALLALGAAAPGGEPDPARALADVIDRHIQAGHDREKVKPAPLSEDAEFLRRVTLHLAGRVPAVSEVRAFLKDASPDKRERVVRELLEGPRY